MKTATLLAVHLPGFQGQANAYELDPPLVATDWWGEDTREVRHVIVSASHVPFGGPETYIFEAKKVGDLFEVSDWGELPGSFRGGLDHEAALAGAGYEVTA